MDIAPTTGLRIPTQAGPQELEQQLLKIRRIGKRLFDVANCIIRIKGQPALPHQGDEGPLTALEEAFCESVPSSDQQVVALDARAEPALAKHKAVVGAPYIRFYAMQPVYDEDHAVIGSIQLVAYNSRQFSTPEQQLLQDLASLIERELHLSRVNASQQDLLKKNRSLRRDSLLDPVVGTWNRSAITRMLATEIERCYNEQKPLSLILADLESWQQIHTTFGHAASDNILIKFSSRLRSCIRPSDALGRYEGESFMVILPGAAGKTAQVIAERMRQTVLAEAEQIGDTALQLHMSIGAVSTDAFPSAAIDDLISLADEARRSARKGGSNRIVLARPEGGKGTRQA